MPMIRAVAAITWCSRFKRLQATLEQDRLQLLPEGKDRSVAFLNPAMWINSLTTGVIVSAKRTVVSLLATVLSPLMVLSDLTSVFVADLPELKRQYLLSVTMILPLTAYTTVKSALQFVGYSLLLVLSPIPIIVGALYIGGSVISTTVDNYFKNI